MATYYVNTTTGNDGVASANGYDITSATKTVTKAGAFASYVYHAGDQIQITVTGGSSRAVVGFYTVASRTSDNAIVLTTDPTAGAGDDTNVTLTVGNTGTAATTSVGALTGPWKTIGKAVDTCAAADVVMVADGTYTETAGGTTYWYISEDFTVTTPLIIRATNSGQVNIKGGSNSTQSVYFDLASGITFEGCNFVNNAGNATALVYIHKESSFIKFIDCGFDDTGRTGDDKDLIRFTNTGSNYAHNIVFDTCAFTHSAASTATSSRPTALAVNLFPGAGDDGTAAGICYGVYFTGCTFGISGNHAGLISARFNDNGIVFDGCTITQTSGTAATRFITIGVDGGNNLLACSGFRLVDNTITTTTSSHAVLVGAGSYGPVIKRNKITSTAADYVLAMKTCIGGEVSDNVFVGGSVATMILRGTRANDIHNNVLYGVRTGIHFDDLAGAAYGTLITRAKFYNNIVWPIYASGDSYACQYAAAEQSECYVDHNCYWGTATGNTPYVANCDSVAKTLATVRTWWTTQNSVYTTNDSHSVWADPVFVDTTDFVPRLGTLVTGGKPDRTGRKTSIGASSFSKSGGWIW